MLRGYPRAASALNVPPPHPVPPPSGRYHHTAVDTVDHVAPEQLQLNAANLAVWAYTVANLPELLPRDTGPAPPDPRGGGSGGGAQSGPSTAAVAIGVVCMVLGVAVLAGAAAALVYGRQGKGPLRGCFQPAASYDGYVAPWAGSKAASNL